ncbi:FAD-linked sulfhydryl oxidase [Paramecium bursaria Chlorella virus NY2B]|uniref:Sulfhydryl oxidase n=1 Tax=Paramecium bursaria Chlorella virus NYs1 TaxID=83442 RepID=M1I3H9_9PHYC|nr:hypothetical protein AR158_C570R [Paramecium bursaria Chlorella virus AR158]YP_009665472.1 FAD-linked sulfhydryl oxidase [Paramecium bursaria Chlorella virus NYs1]AGE54326.1 FAD-linked sulfhydryl oxidase [Paramecium bursaria Chlorella virus IL-5-2s1]AGE55012.1 FAD-linked sulfhydryl oxidase [Paramecium bursaria Chlorella virus MA1D]AGE58444.1 FAD-linked sulfhydryl oxidase [Paramecium bursaria Chlorella virus NY2B]ABU44115.1 hypothetical protein AR158_C570R [Paramecium bursaria Chlorella viru
MNSNKAPNFDPKIWGASFWFSAVHLPALRFPVNPTISDKKRFETYYKSLPYVIPCDGCCIGFTKILEMTKFGAKDLKNRDALFSWTVKAHSLVNIKTGKEPRNEPEYWKKQYLSLANK